MLPFVQSEAEKKAHTGSFRKIAGDPVFIVLALSSVGLHLYSACNLEYHRDEMLYFALGNHPAAGYNSVPPLIGWIAWLMQLIFGQSLFAVRLSPSLASGAMIFLVASIAKEMGASRYGSLLAATGLMISGFFMRSFFLFMPVFLEILIWTYIFYLVIRYINSGNDRILVFIGIAAGFALLTKYLAALLIAGIISILPFTRLRSVFRKKALYLGALAAFAVFLPNLLWQVWKGFPVFGHMDELYETQLVHMDVPLFLYEQLMMPVAGTFFTVAGIIFLLFSRKAASFRPLGYLAAFVIIALLLLKGKSYYTLGVFPLLISAGAVAWDSVLKGRWIRLLFPALLIALTIPIVPIGLPVLNREGLVRYFANLEEKYGIDLGRRFEDGTIHSLPQDYADMLGWEEMTALAAKAWEMVEDKDAAFIFGESYGHASAVSVIGRKYGLPEALSFNESFQYWLPERFDPDITSIVYINDDEPGEDVRHLFNKIVLIGKVSDPHAREYGTQVYLATEPAVSFNQFWEERLKKGGQ